MSIHDNFPRCSKLRNHSNEFRVSRTAHGSTFLKLNSKTSFSLLPKFSLVCISSLSYNLLGDSNVTHFESLLCIGDNISIRVRHKTKPIRATANRRLIKSLQYYLYSETKRLIGQSGVSKSMERSGLVRHWRMHKPWRMVIGVCSNGYYSINRYVKYLTHIKEDRSHKFRG